MARPRLIMAIAPAGYGKSTVIRQYAATSRRSALCDCIDVASPASLAQEVATALARDDPQRTAALTQQRLSGSRDAASWSAFAIDLWSQASPHDLFVFENVDRILDSVQNVELLSRLLARTPRERRLALCSRRALPFAWHRFFAAHEALALRSNDLRFDMSEIAQAFAGLDLPPESIERVADMTRGWPIAVLLLARLARLEGGRSLPALVESLADVDIEDLYDYLSDQVLALMPPQRFARLVAVAAIPRATAAEVATALDDPAARIDLELFARTSPFLYAVAEDVYEAHPLVRGTLWQRNREVTRNVLRRAAGAFAASAPLRAAQLYMALGDREAAATLLENEGEFMATEISVGFAEIVAGLEGEILVRHPGLWATATAVRATNMPHAQWLQEALIARDNCKPTTPMSAWIGVHASLVNVLSNLGRHEEARAAFTSFEQRFDALPETYRPIRELFLSALLAREGRFTEAVARWREAEPLFADVKFSRAIMLEEVTARAARFRADRPAERAALETAVALARASRNALAIALTLEESAFAAWFAGEDDAFARHVRDLHAAIEPTTVRATEVFRNASRGDVSALGQHDDVEHPKVRFYAALIGCASATGAERVELSRTALASAISAGEPMSVAIACVACAELAPGDRKAMISQAKAACKTVDSSALRAAVEAYAGGDPACGMLAPLVNRLRSKGQSATPLASATYCVSLSRSCIEREGRQVKLSGRELELITFLAARRHVCRAAEIMEALWPETESTDQSVLRVNVQRVRSKLGADAIVVARDGYALGENVFVDLDRIEQATRDARGELPVRADVRRALQASLDGLLSERSASSEAWEWFGPVRVRLDDLAREIATLLGRDALERGDVGTALTLGQRIVERDPCDEPARELRIRAHLRAGDRASAFREFRIYREVLESELGATPSVALGALLQSEALS